jgi:anti-sigma factor RsiW
MGGGAMSCARFRGDLSAWIDGELPAARASAVAAHVEGCAECRAHGDALRGVDRALGAIPLPEVSPDALTVLRRRIAAEPQPRLARGATRRTPARRWRYALGAGAAAAAALVLYLVTATDLLDEATPEELSLAFDLDTVEDLEVIANLELLEALMALEEGSG